MSYYEEDVAKGTQICCRQCGCILFNLIGSKQKGLLSTKRFLVTKCSNCGLMVEHEVVKTRSVKLIGETIE